MRKRDFIFAGIIAAVIIIAGIRECTNSNRSDDLLSAAANYSDSAKFYKGKNDVVIAYNQSLVLEKESQLKDLLHKYDTLSRVLKKFSDIQSTTIIRERVLIEHDTISFTSIIPCDFPPINVHRDSVHYVFDGTISRDLFVINKIEIPNKQDIVIGTKKTGLLKRERRVEIINSNPLIKPISIQNYVIDDRKKWHQRTWVHVAVGMALGGAGVHYLNKK